MSTTQINKNLGRKDGMDGFFYFFTGEIKPEGIYDRDSEKTRSNKKDIYVLVKSVYPSKKELQMAEKDVIAAIRRYLKTEPRCFFWKEHGGAYGTAGIPDIICCIDGRFVAFEVKTENGKATELQLNTIYKIHSAGGQAFVVRSVEEVRTAVTHLAEEKEDKNDESVQ